MKALIIATAAAFMYMATPAAVQAQTTQAEIQRLQDNVYDAGTDIARLRDRDSRLADSLQRDLDDLGEEVVYLKVKLRKESSVPRSEYADLRDRIERVRTQARGEAQPASNTGRSSSNNERTSNERTSNERTSPTVDPPSNPTSPTEIPVGTEFDVRLQTRLNSETARVEDRFDATTIVAYERNGRVLAPAGSVMRGIVSSVTPAGRGLERKGAMTLNFDRMSISGRTYSARATVVGAIEAGNDNQKVVAGAGVGAIIGGILGGFKGALAGILIGGGGTVAATEGKDVDLPPGTVLRIRVDAPIDVGN